MIPLIVYLGLIAKFSLFLPELHLFEEKQTCSHPLCKHLPLFFFFCLFFKREDKKNTVSVFYSQQKLFCLPVVPSRCSDMTLSENFCLPLCCEYTQIKFETNFCFTENKKILVWFCNT